MKLNKKFLSCLLAGTMVMAPMTAFADNSTTITGSGTVNAVDTEVFNVVLPTSTGINFTVDPFGLLKLSGGTTKDLAALVSDAAGTVTSTATAVVNKSSVGINVAVDAWLDVSGASLTTTDDKAVAEAGNADLYLTISRISGAAVKTVVTNAAVSMGATDAVLKGTYNLSSAAITGGTLLSGSASNAITSVSSAAASSFSFALEDVAEYYKVTSQGAITLDEAFADSQGGYTDSAYVFVIDGYANPKSDVWNALSDTTNNPHLKLNLKFTITSADAVKTAYSTFASNNYWISSASDLATGFNSTVTNVKVNGVDTATSNYTVNNDGYLLIPKTVVDYYKSADGACALTITTSDGTYSITL